MHVHDPNIPKVAHYSSLEPIMLKKFSIIPFQIKLPKNFTHYSYFIPIARTMHIFRQLALYAANSCYNHMYKYIIIIYNNN